jgi:hypothetical protein
MCLVTVRYITETLSHLGARIKCKTKQKVNIKNYCIKTSTGKHEKR